MTRTLQTFAAALVVVLLLSGCASTEDKGNAQAVAPSPSDDEGQILGFVQDEAELPLEGAQAGLVEMADVRPVSTSADGAFVLSALPPGSYKVIVSKVGYESETRQVDVSAGASTEVTFRLKSLQVSKEPYAIVIVGETYIACGAYVWGYSVTNVNTCPWDAAHQPRFEFTVARSDLRGLAQEVTWVPSSPLTAEKLRVGLWYKLECNPFCDAEAQYTTGSAPSPVRLYGDLTGEKFAEDPVPLISTTYVGGSGQEIVVVYQQRVTHFLTAFYNAPGDLDTYTAIPT